MSRFGDEWVALAKVRDKYMDQFLKTDLHFFLGTTKEFHSWATNPFLIIGAFQSHMKSSWACCKTGRHDTNSTNLHELKCAEDATEISPRLARRAEAGRRRKRDYPGKPLLQNQPPVLLIRGSRPGP
jgi:hypothetical protein